MTSLEAEAANAATSPVRLQELANNYPRLRPLIAMNPTAYPALVDWLAGLGDPAVNVALAQRNATFSPTPDGPRRISVMGRETPQSEPDRSSALGVAALPNPEPASGPRTDEISVVAQTPSSQQKAVILGLVALVAFLALFAFLFLGLLNGPKASETAETSGAGASTGTVPDQDEGGDEATDEGGEEEPSNTDESTTARYPAPSEALTLTHFVSPSGNIACRLGTEGATCTIKSHSFVDSAVATCGVGPLSVTGTRESAGLDCSAAQVDGAGATTLSYGDYATAEDYACESSEIGVSCWNTISGVGFFIAREGYQISVVGPIIPGTVSWG